MSRSNKETEEEGLGSKLILPGAVLLVALFIPFSINYFMHVVNFSLALFTPVLYLTIYILSQQDLLK